jgi:hypothetical protein
MILQCYLLDLKRQGILSTADIEVKNAVVEYLKKNDMKFICTMDDNFQYIIQLV